jgi:uncharacterized cupin superfamily protein
MTDRRHPRIVNVEELPAITSTVGRNFGAARRRFAPEVGARGLSTSWYEVPPGRSAFPFHYHCANEEAMFILDGSGTLRIGGDTVAVRAGDYVAFPPGPEAAHRLDNTGSTPLRYLCIATTHLTEVCGYPDSDKLLMVSTPSHEAGWRREMNVMHITRGPSTIEYFDGEDIGGPSVAGA